MKSTFIFWMQDLSFSKMLVWMDFCHATAMLTSVELSEELSFCCAKHDVKVLERQQLESRLLLLEFIRPVWHYRWVEAWMACPSRPVSHTGCRLYCPRNEIWSCFLIKCST